MGEEYVNWFFIRYWEGGPHIRLRFVNQNNLKQKVISEGRRFFQNNRVESIDRDLFYFRSSFDGKDIDSTTLPWYESGSIIEKAYIPETERYGDGELLQLSERIFHLSSQMVVEIIKQSISLNAKLYSSIYIMSYLLKGLGFLEYNFLDLYQKYWKSLSKNELKVANQGILDNIIESIMLGKNRNKLLDYYIERILQEFSEIKALTTRDGLAYILSSQLHMTNNRLSVTPELEYLVSRNVRDYIGEMEKEPTELP